MLLRSTTAVALLASSVAAQQTSFFASAVSYCSPARAIEVSNFQLEYFPDTSEIAFNLSAKSIPPNLNAILDFQLVAYGIKAVNVSLNLCDYLSGVLCPLPQYDFIGSATIPLPALVAGSIDIPSIAYSIPDLQAIATVRLLQTANGTEAACLQVNLSNGKTVRLDVVSWALFGLAVGSIVVGILGGIILLAKGGDATRGRRKERFVGLVAFYQFVASTGLLSITYPLVYTSFAANFAWSLGLVFVQSFQDNIYATRERTGGNLTQPGGGLVGGTLATGLQRRSILPSESIFKRATNATAASSSTIPTFADLSSIVPTGIPRFLTKLTISPQNGYLTILIWFLLALTAFIALTLVLAVPYGLLIKRDVKRLERDGRIVGNGVVQRALDLVRGNALRLLLISYFPLTIFTFYSWVLGSSDSYAPIVLSVFVFLATTTSLLLLTFFFTRRVRSNKKDSTSMRDGEGAYAPLSSAFKDGRRFFFVVTLSAIFIRSLFIGFAQKNGFAQTIGLLLVEIIVLVLQLVLQPYDDRSSNGLNITVQIFRVIISGALIAFNPSLGLMPIPSVIVGLVIAVIEAIVVIIYFILILTDLISYLLLAFRRRPDDLPRSQQEMQERGSERSSVTLAEEEGRARNAGKRRNESSQFA